MAIFGIGMSREVKAVKVMVTKHMEEAYTATEEAITATAEVIGEALSAMALGIREAIPALEEIAKVEEPSRKNGLEAQSLWTGKISFGLII